MLQFCQTIKKGCFFVNAGLLLLIVILGWGCDSSDTKSKDQHVYASGLKTELMRYHAAEQLADNWCWAACVQMVLSTKDIKIRQSEIVQRAFGKVINRPGSIKDIAESIDGLKVNRNGRLLQITSLFGFGSPSLDILIKYLEQETPIIMGVFQPNSDTGHAVVVTAVIYEMKDKKFRVRRVQVRDPAPEYVWTEGKRSLSPEEFAQVGFYAVVVTDT